MIRRTHLCRHHVFHTQQLYRNDDGLLYVSLINKHLNIQHTITARTHTYDSYRLARPTLPDTTMVALGPLAVVECNQGPSQYCQKCIDGDLNPVFHSTKLVERTKNPHHKIGCAGASSCCQDLIFVEGISKYYKYRSQLLLH